MKTIPSKLPNVGTTIFSIMSQLALDHNAINLGQGFPDFQPDPKLINAVNKAMLDGHNQYPPMAGIPKLRQEIADKIQTLYGHRYDETTEVTVTSGASEALMISILAFIHPGDEVIVIEPVYDLYIPTITLAGGTPVVVPMQSPTKTSPRYSIDWERVRAAVTNNTRMLILNFPHNPTGINLTEEDLDALERLISETGIVILSDEVYEHIVFNGETHKSLCSRPSLAAHSVVISSFGKTYHVTGWKVGYCCAPAHLSKELRKVHQFNVFTVPTPLQVGIADYMEDPEPYLQLSHFYQQKHDHLFKGLTRTKLVPIKSEGTFFLLANYSNVSDKNEVEFVRWLTTEVGVTAIPIAAFYKDPDAQQANNHLIRLCFAKDEATLDQAIQRLEKL